MCRPRPLFASLYAPVFFLGFVGSALALPSDERLLAMLGLLLVAIGASFAAERLVPYERPWNQPRADGGRDLAHAIVNESLGALSVASVPWLLAHLPHFDLWPSEWPLALQLLVAIVIADLGITLTHYASHRAEPLWRLHAVHHSVSRMYGFNGLLKHPLHQALETAVGSAPLLAIGMPVEVAALLGFAVAIQLLLQHSNVDMRVGPLAYVWALAPTHRHHHLASKTEGDVNFGLFTLLWDHLLGTFVLDRPAPRDGQLGVAGRENYPAGYLAQLVQPFKERR